MEFDAVGESAHHLMQAHGSNAPEASSDDCSAVHLQHPSPPKAETSSRSSRHQQKPSSQPPVQHPSAVYSHSASTKASSRKRKQPEPPSNAREAEQTAQLADAPTGISHAQQASSIQTDAQTDAKATAVPQGRKSKRKPDKSGPEADGSTQSAPSTGKGRPRVNYAGVLGKTIDIPAPVFDVDIPDLFYRGTVLKKDRAHPGAVVIRFHEDGSRYWFPVSEVERFLQNMQEHGRSRGSETIGQGSDNFAAEVLAGSYEAELSTGAHPGKTQPPLRHLSRPKGGQDQSSEHEALSSLEALAAAAGSGQA